MFKRIFQALTAPKIPLGEPLPPPKFSGSVTCMILLRTPKPVSSKVVAEHASKFAPDDPIVFQDMKQELMANKIPVVHIDYERPKTKQVLIATMIPTKLPGPEVDAAVQTSSGWPASESPVQYGAFLTVTAAGSDDAASLVNAASRIAYGFLKEGDATAWYSSAASLLTPPAFAMQVLELMLPHGVTPIPLWVNMLTQTQGHLVSAMTLGMQQFGEPEFEVVQSPLPHSEVVANVQLAATLPLERAHRYRTGEYIGAAAGNPWLVEVGPSKMSQLPQVVRLTMK